MFSLPLPFTPVWLVFPVLLVLTNFERWVSSAEFTFQVLWILLDEMLEACHAVFSGKTERDSYHLIVHSVLRSNDQQLLWKPLTWSVLSDQAMVSVSVRLRTSSVIIQWGFTSIYGGSVLQVLWPTRSMPLLIFIELIAHFFQDEQRNFRRCIAVFRATLVDQDLKDKD